MLLLNHPTLLRGNLYVGRIGNLIIIIFLVLVYSSMMRGVVNHVPPGFCPSCGAAGLKLRLTYTAYRKNVVFNESAE